MRNWCFRIHQWGRLFRNRSPVMAVWPFIVYSAKRELGVVLKKVWSPTQKSRLFFLSEKICGPGSSIFFKCCILKLWWQALYCFGIGYLTSKWHAFTGEKLSIKSTTTTADVLFTVQNTLLNRSELTYI